MVVGHAVLAAVARLPRPVLRLLAGRPRVVAGRTLAPEVQLALRLTGAARGEPAAGTGVVDVAQMRARTAFQAAVVGSRPRVHEVFAAGLAVPGAVLPARVYRPSARRAAGVVVYLHGGGWVTGDLDTHDGVCRALARGSGLTVVSVAYRRAPEHPYPVPVEDAVAGFRAVRDHPVAAGLPVAVAGDSAGGALAAVVARRTRDDVRDGGEAGSGAPVAQLLLYPGTDLTSRRPSFDAFGTGYALTAADVDRYRDLYLGVEPAGAGAPPPVAAEPDASPLLAPDTDLTGVAPAYVAVAGFDVLHDEGVAYAGRLRGAGVPTTLVVEEGLVHAFANLAGASRTAAHALERAARALGALVAAAPAPGSHA
ncbi:alpha/beta hydrolase [Xylanimonas oleitrophica]|uniref:Alpha/beta hydrolase n=1 Tax=Xylanimonas oleitrophica TaxID=2607479 RepID=A0A2W5WQ02_9MICO|nr:alpha/beta hydrolase [Xylanimonas oleitrophica]